MELIADSTEQIYVRPLPTAAPDVVRNAKLTTAFVPAMSGLGTEEPLYQRPKVDQLLGQAKPGDVLRNLLVEAAGSEPAWTGLQESIRRLFGFELAPPDATGAHILAEYRERPGGPALDIASAGSGFQQVLMLLAFLRTRPGAVLLLDEPDAHLHVILQDAIYGELRAVAAQLRSQLIIATHSEVIINGAEPRELCVLFDGPRMLATTEDQARVILSLKVLSQTDMMLALTAPGVLYLENYTDRDILREWARVLGHPAHDLFSSRTFFWRPTVAETRTGSPGIRAPQHHEALQLIHEDLPALELVDGDARPEIQPTQITGRGFQRLRWRRYEIESRGGGGRPAHRRPAEIPPGELPASGAPRSPGRPCLPQCHEGAHGTAPTRPCGRRAPGAALYPVQDIAAVMRPEEIHPEVVEKLDGIMRAFGL